MELINWILIIVTIELFIFYISKLILSIVCENTKVDVGE